MKDKRVHHPGLVKEEIGDCCEKALQRAICAAKCSTVGGSNIRWIDYELPVAENRQARDLCLDLIGIDADGRYVLCEIKFSRRTDGNGNPNSAGNQICAYKKILEEHLSGFRYHLNNSDEVFSVDAFKRLAPRLIVVANEEYWNKWNTKLRIARYPLVKGVEYYSMPIDPDYFKAQKGAAKKYRPILKDCDNVWREVIR